MEYILCWWTTPACGLLFNRYFLLLLPYPTCIFSHSSSIFSSFFSLPHLPLLFNFPLQIKYRLSYMPLLYYWVTQTHIKSAFIPLEQSFTHWPQTTICSMVLPIEFLSKCPGDPPSPRLCELFLPCFPHSIPLHYLILKEFEKTLYLLNEVHCPYHNFP